jgi:hypothetical protein
MRTPKRGYSKAEIEALNKLISPYQGSAYGGVKTEHERMLKAQARKRRQLRRNNPEFRPPKSQAQRDGEKWGWIIGISASALVVLILLATGG